MSPTNKPYDGPAVCLVIAIDVGTTFSGVSYAILRPGEIPKVQGVTKFPDQDSVAGDAKVPSIMYYDSEGEMVAAGASTLDQNIINLAQDEGWKRVEHFKLHLRPSDMVLETNGFEITPLPPNVTAEKAFGNFLKYLYECTITYIEETTVDGPQFWEGVKDYAQFVLTHPNGWGGAQQQRMRNAAIYAGIIQDNPDDHGRLTFLTEGEASLHACLSNGHVEVRLDDAFILADAGGGTLDVTSYVVESVSPLSIRELVTPDCRFAGSIFVNMAAMKLFQERLQDSDYDDEHTMDFLLQEFDRTTKRVFLDDSKPQWVTIGGPSESNAKLGIRNGKLKLEGDEVAKCFEFSVEEATNSILDQFHYSTRQSMDVWLVGGFSASPWLYNQLKTRLESDQLAVYHPDSYASKAVADGAVMFFSDHAVYQRVAKQSIGVQYSSQYDPNDPEHKSPRRKRFRHLSGLIVVGGQFHCFVSQGTAVAETEVFRQSFFREITQDDARFSIDIYGYSGLASIPNWIDDDSDNFRRVCAVNADLLELCNKSTRRVSPNGKVFYHLEFDIEVLFGLTELRARVRWKDETTHDWKYGPATVDFDI